MTMQPNESAPAFSPFQTPPSPTIVPLTGATIHASDVCCDFVGGVFVLHFTEERHLRPFAENDQPAPPVVEVDRVAIGPLAAVALLRQLLAARDQYERQFGHPLPMREDVRVRINTAALAEAVTRDVVSQRVATKRDPWDGFTLPSQRGEGGSDSAAPVPDPAAEDRSAEPTTARDDGADRPDEHDDRPAI